MVYDRHVVGRLARAMLAAMLFGPGCGPGADGGGLPEAGSVTIFYETTSTGWTGGVSASFSRTTGGSCTQRTVGPCSVARCDYNGGAPRTTNLSAGAITITGGMPGTITFSPLSDGSYDYSGTYSFAAGETLDVSAAGGTVPAFTASVTFPTAITVTAPTTGTIDRSQDLAIAWTGGDASVLAKIQEGTSDRGVLIQCVFDASAGSGTIPAGALSDLEAVALGSGGNEGDLSVDSVSIQKVSPGGLPVTVTAGSNAFSALPVVR
jgi:hypothetical protein